MNPRSIDFVASALCDAGSALSLADFMRWLEARREAHRFRIDPIPFNGMQQWCFEPSTGNLAHQTGRFFKIEGVWVETNYGLKRQWSQPIINQPEIGILGILVRRIGGVLHFLMQAKMEPGNLNVVQLAPTLQATRSNFTRAHQGRTPPYLEHFLDQGRHRVLVDVLQSEQGARFLKKRNRNIVLEVREDVPLLDDYCWLTLGQIQRLVQCDNLVNMDARTVLSCISYGNGPSNGWTAAQLLDRAVSGTRVALCSPPERGSFQARILESAVEQGAALHAAEDIIAWFTDLKFRYELSVEKIPLKYVQEWVVGKDRISHRECKYFSVIAVRVEAENREVPSWTQPLVKPCQQGIIAFVVKRINGVLHFLVQGKVEVGNFDVVEMAPTVQCLTGSYRELTRKEFPPFLDCVLNAPPEQVRYSGMQSEEGGRFYQEQNLNLIVEVDESFAQGVPANYIWMTLRQLKEFILHNNFVNVQARCLLSCLSLAGEQAKRANRSALFQKAAVLDADPSGVPQEVAD